MIHDMSAALYKRAADFAGGDEDYVYSPPWWTVLIYFVDLIIFLPLWIYASYTLSKVFPTFAIIEDENPPAYQPVSLNDDAASIPEDPERIAAAPGHPNKKLDVLGGPTVTSSIRSIHRLLRANGGWRAFFRGFSIKVVQGFLTTILIGIFSGSLGGVFTPLATLLASLTLVQFSAAWVHIVITPASPKHFWRRLPPFRRTFEATWRAVGLYWLATEVARWLPFLVAYLGGITFEDASGFSEPGAIHKHANYRTLGVGIGAFLVAILSGFFLVLPAHVILVRVQASLLPVEEDTIIPFDRSFESRVEPAIVGGRGYATIKDAWATFTRAAWRRLVVLSIKIALIGIAIFVAFIVVLVPEIIVVTLNTEKVKRPN